MGVQVQRLLQRDRKELTGVEEIGASFRAEFDDGREGATEASGEGGASANGTGPSPSSSGSPFGAGAPQLCLHCPSWRLPGTAGSCREPPPAGPAFARKLKQPPALVTHGSEQA